MGGCGWVWGGGGGATTRWWSMLTASIRPKMVFSNLTKCSLFGAVKVVRRAPPLELGNADSGCHPGCFPTQTQTRFKLHVKVLTPTT